MVISAAPRIAVPVADSQLKLKRAASARVERYAGSPIAGAVHRRRLDRIVAEDEPMERRHVERRRQHRVRRRRPAGLMCSSAMPAGPPFRKALIGPAPHAVTNTDRNTHGIQARITAARL